MQPVSPLNGFVDKEFFFASQPMTLRLKVPSYVEGPEFRKKMQAFSAADDVEKRDQALDPTWLGEIFGKWVKLPKPVQLEGWDGPVTLKTGKDLMEVANTGLVYEVLGEFNRLSALTAEEGKASGSPSTSPAATAPSSGSASPATPTEGAGGISA